MDPRAFLKFALCLACGTTALSPSLPSAAAVSPDVLKNGIKEEHILHGEPTVTVTGTDVFVDGWRDAADTDNDCKINAVLAARKVFQIEKEAALVTVRFRDMLNSAIYSEVIVTIGDVTAFGAGAISKEQLLSAMRLRRVAPEAAITVKPSGSSVPSASPDSAVDSKTPAVAAATTGGTTSTPPARVTAAPSSAGSARFNSYGLSFPFPAGWTPSAPGGNVAVRLSMRGASKQNSLIDLRVYSSQQAQPATIVALPAQTIFEEIWSAAWIDSMPEEIRESMAAMVSMRQAYSRRYPGRRTNSWQTVKLNPVTIPTSTKVGTTKAPALQKAFWATSLMSPREYLRTVSFSTGQYTYQFNLVSPATDSALANAALEQVLAALSLKR